jgi:hypothetical protein
LSARTSQNAQVFGARFLALAALDVLEERTEYSGNVARCRVPGVVWDEDVKARSPRIEDLSWGRLAVQDQAQQYKDAKLFPGGSREWDWAETGTNHSPGIQPADVEELLEHGADVVVLSRGMLDRLKTCPQTLAFLKEREIEVHVLPTKEAAELYNRLCASRQIGALIHTTC